MVKNTKSALIVGVGGQGTLLASKILGKVMIDSGYDVKMSEVHGMSQRGGSVVTYVRWGEGVASPIVTRGEADYIISFEKIEAARYTECLKPDGVVVTNSRETDPMPVITGAAEYPHDILDRMKSAGIDVRAFDALSLAEEAGSSKAVNIVLLGYFARLTDISPDVWIEAVKSCVKSRFVEMNVKAFGLGYGVQ